VWRCDECRSKGLENKRRCGYLPRNQNSPERPVWAGGPVILTECPRSAIKPLSITLLEQFLFWRMCGKPDLRSYSAKAADAFLVIESEFARESKHGNE
jgi:hypothetical protein